MKNFIVTWQVVLAFVLFFIGGYIFIDSFMIAYRLGITPEGNKELVFSVVFFVFAWLAGKIQE